jgi:hypothetical protein
MKTVCVSFSSLIGKSYLSLANVSDMTNSISIGQARAIGGPFKLLLGDPSIKRRLITTCNNL